MCGCANCILVMILGLNKYFGDAYFAVECWVHWNQSQIAKKKLVALHYWYGAWRRVTSRQAIETQNSGSGH